MDLEQKLIDLAAKHPLPPSWTEARWQGDGELRLGARRLLLPWAPLFADGRLTMVGDLHVPVAVEGIPASAITVLLRAPSVSGDTAEKSEP